MSLQDSVNRILAKRQLTPLTPWQKSSETPPPKDGRQILICMGDIVAAVVWRKQQNSWFGQRRMGGWPDTPDYWMPIPPLPEQTNGD